MADGPITVRLTLSETLGKARGQERAISRSTDVSVQVVREGRRTHTCPPGHDREGQLVARAPAVRKREPDAGHGRVTPRHARRQRET